MVRVCVLAAERELSVADLLVMIEAVVPGDRAGDRDSEQVVRPAFEAEHLEADEERAERAVGHTGEEAAHADRRRERGGVPRQSRRSRR